MSVQDRPDNAVLSSSMQSVDQHVPAQQISTSRPIILLMGLSGSGKTSIQHVIFRKMLPNETLYLDSTHRIHRAELTSFIRYSVWDVPDHIGLLDPPDPAVWIDVGAVMFIIDAQADYEDALGRLVWTLIRAFEVKPSLVFDVCIHKADSLSEEYKLEVQRDIRLRTMDALDDEGYDDIRVDFHITSIYEHSALEVCSRVVQRLVPQLPILENLLDILCTNSGIEKAFLFDSHTKLYLATDSTPTDAQSYEICCDTMNLVLDLAELYEVEGYQENGEERAGGKIEGKKEEKHPSPTGPSSGPSTPQRQPLQDSEDSFSIVHLSDTLTLYMRQFSPLLVLICLIRTEAYEKQGLLDYNVNCFREAVLDVHAVQRKRGGSRATNSSSTQEGGQEAMVALEGDSPAQAPAQDYTLSGDGLTGARSGGQDQTSSG